MSTVDIALASFAWGIIVGIIVHRGITTGHWSIWPWPPAGGWDEHYSLVMWLCYELNGERGDKGNE